MKKIIEVDWDSLGDCYGLLSELKSRISQLNSINHPAFELRADRVKRVFETCLKIYETDISSVYDTISLDPSPMYYVYLHCDPAFKLSVTKDGLTAFAATLGATHLPFYVGKGTGNRVNDLNRNDSHRKVRQKIKQFDGEIITHVILDELTEIQALTLESKLIDIFELRSFGGMLVNLDEGINYELRRKIYATDLMSLNKFYKEALKS